MWKTCLFSILMTAIVFIVLLKIDPLAPTQGELRKQLLADRIIEVFEKKMKEDPFSIEEIEIDVRRILGINSVPYDVEDLVEDFFEDKDLNFYCYGTECSLSI